MVVCVILAAGRSTRFGTENKLVAIWEGKPLVRHVYDAAVTSDLDRVTVVTGHDAELVAHVLPSGADIIHNVNYRSGMASSIRAGISHNGASVPIMIMLGDMPLVTANHINLMVAAFKSAGSGASIVVATHESALGNPVLFGVDHLPALMRLEGDRGARALISAATDDLIKVEIGEAARRDFDTQSSFSA